MAHRPAESNRIGTFMMAALLVCAALVGAPAFFALTTALLIPVIRQIDGGQQAAAEQRYRAVRQQPPY
ncbi:hypothetical protein [Nocardia niwae]|uniref:hypothetical protein n=1 Tax=Nocardia niwae TaxID=626084 RepID=UPI0007A4B570|nr:hypothetical protein [Nocardia niwae]